LSAIDPIPEPACDPGEVPPPLPAAPPAVARPAPVGDEERLETLDVIRGIAVLGILLVNIESFGMVREARYFPDLGGGEGPWNSLVWLFTFLFADTKFIAIFTMLFGAGIAVYNDRRRRKRSRGVWAVYYRRMFFLLALGAAHGLFLWRGDILYFYAFWGLALYLVPRAPAWWLAVLGLGLYAWHVQDFAEQLADAGSRFSWWEEQIYQGGWQDQFDFRKQMEEYYLLHVPFEFAPHLVGLMLLGMAMYKNGFLAGAGRTGAYAAAGIVTLGAGTAMVVHATRLNAGIVDQWAGREFIWGSLMLSFGYILAAITLTKLLGQTSPVRALAATGRMALTNYLMQTVICTTIFYGYGFGMFNRATRLEQSVLVVGIWLFQIVFSYFWIGNFRFGPVEWVWRTVSYLRWQPMLRPARSDSTASTAFAGE